MTWWNTDWQYKREITIQENSGNNLTDYQVKIVLNSSNFDFSKANSDGSDIRFVDSDDTTPLSYWIEKWDSVNQEAIVWVKVPSIPANSTKTIYMYYGNPSATSESNGENVFIWYDDASTNKLSYYTNEGGFYYDSTSKTYYHKSEDEWKAMYISSVPVGFEVIGEIKGRFNYDCAKSFPSIFISIGGNRYYFGTWDTNILGGIQNIRLEILRQTDTVLAYTDLGALSEYWGNFMRYGVRATPNGFTLIDYHTNTTISYSISLSGNADIGFGIRKGRSSIYYTAEYRNLIIRKYIDPEPSISISSETEIGGWAYPNWQYRRQITIQENSGNTLTDYQVKLVIDTATLISEGKMNSDCSDMRFADIFGNPIPYWIESGQNTSNTIVWIKVPNIPASGTARVYMYYGNPSASSESNGDATFEFFDDFEDGTIDTNKWTVDGTTATEANGVLNIDGRETVVYSNELFTPPFVAFSKFTVVSVDGQMGFSLVNNPSTTSTPRIYYLPTGYEDWYIDNDGDGTYEVDAVDLFTEANGDKHEVEIKVTSSEVKLRYVRNGVENSRTDPYGFSSDLRVVLGGYKTGMTSRNEEINFDFVYVRKYASSEPTYLIGEEEIREITLELTDGFQLTELYRVGVSKLATESISVGDVLSKQPSITKTESISVSDIFEKLPTKVLTETSTLSDVISRGITKGITETLSVSDVTTKSLQRLFEELSTLADYISKLTKKEFVETSQLIDSIQTIRKIVQEITETVSLSDVAYKVASKILQETETLTDIIKTRITAKSITETLILQDIIAKSLSRIIAESIALADYVYKKPILTFTETISTMDYVTAKILLIKNLWEYLSLTDYLEIKPAVTPPTLREMINLDKKMALKFITSTARYLEWRKERLT